MLHYDNINADPTLEARDDALALVDSFLEASSFAHIKGKALRDFASAMAKLPYSQKNDVFYQLCETDSPLTIKKMRLSGPTPAEQIRCVFWQKVLKSYELNINLDSANPAYFSAFGDSTLDELRRDAQHFDPDFARFAFGDGPQR